ncbi:unnamed protein product [Macrosiphum euphorbiae]|uniref:FLYWCH-type domain-containing protein n=2 Tax=Macrosiphum euphorbiae TaxID=13131 RepID=A0AAV0WVC7_9HEMI|nr:unnamed protein product [Macrosiphum euphorbiae]
MEIINSNKNNNKLCYEGYMYVRKHTGKSRIAWRCSKATMLKCPGTIYTNIEKSKILEIETSHIITHRPNTNEVKVSKCYNEMKIQAKTTKTNPAHIFGECVAKLDDKSQMPPEKIVKRTLRNQRTKNNPLDSDEIVGKSLKKYD